MKVENKHLVYNAEGNGIVLSRNCDLVIVDDKGREKSRHHVPYGTKLLVAEDAKVKKGQKVAEWDPFTIPVITEKSGRVELVDLINNVSVKEVVDEINRRCFQNGYRLALQFQQRRAEAEHYPQG